MNSLLANGPAELPNLAIHSLRRAAVHNPKKYSPES